jgi:hypothetical protein
VNAGSGCETEPLVEETAGESLVEAGEGRAVAIALTVLLACGLALLPAAVGLHLMSINTQELAAALGGATLVLGIAKILALSWAVAERFWPGRPVRLADAHSD